MTDKAPARRTYRLERGMFRDPSSGALHFVSDEVYAIMNGLDQNKEVPCDLLALVHRIYERRKIYKEEGYSLLVGKEELKWKLGCYKRHIEIMLRDSVPQEDTTSAVPDGVPQLPGINAQFLIEYRLLPELRFDLDSGTSHQPWHIQSEIRFWTAELQKLKNMENMDLMVSSHPALKELLGELFVEETLANNRFATSWTMHFVPEHAEDLGKGAVQFAETLIDKFGIPDQKRKAEIKRQIRKLCRVE